MLECPLCRFSVETLARLINHLTSLHSGDRMSFSCDVDGCQRTFLNRNNWRSHVYRNYRAALSLQQPPPMLQNFTADATDPDNCLSDNDLTDIEQQGIAAAPDLNGVNLTPHDLIIKFPNVFRYAVVNFSLKIREDYLLNQSTVTKILSDVHGLFECFSISFQQIRAQLWSVCLSVTINPNIFIIREEIHLCQMTCRQRSTVMIRARRR